jgi:uncharacterized protein
MAQSPIREEPRKVFATPTSDPAGPFRRFAVCAVFAMFPLSGSWAADGQDVSVDFFSMDRPPDPGEGSVGGVDIVPFWTSDLRQAVRAYRSGKFAEAAQLFRKISQDGNIVADWYLGHMCHLGLGVPPDEAQSFSYYNRVAEAFDPDEPRDTRLRIMIDAIVKVGQFYRTGIEAAGVPQNLERATTLFKLAASYGHPEAQYALGLMSLNGKRQKTIAGLQWLLSAAKKRYTLAEAKLGDLYWEGSFVKQDRTRALMWYILAQEAAQPARDRSIIDRYKSLMDQATEEERLEAAARAKVWSDQYPLPKPTSLAE